MLQILQTPQGKWLCVKDNVSNRHYGKLCNGLMVVYSEALRCLFGLLARITGDNESLCASSMTLYFAC